MTTFINRSSEIKDFPFQDYAALNATEMEEQADKHGLKNYNSWMLPQMVAFFGSFTYKTLGLNKKLDTMALGRDNIGKDPWKQGIWKVATQLRRSALVKAQNNAQYANFSALVPLILSGLKKHQNIPYSAWDLVGLEHMVDKGLLEAMTCEVPEGLTTEDILYAREIGLQVKTGNRAGEPLNPLSAWRLTGVKATALGNLPALATTMLAQIWVAHPTLRSQYMVLDPRDWDVMPEPLIAEAKQPAKMFSNTTSNPWG